MGMERKWWSENLRMIQYNLQVQDTGKMIPKEIAQGVKKMKGNALVLNVGGIYAWYESRVPFHHRNEYLPAEKDLLKEIICCCHEEKIRVIGRFDFSKTDDVVYLQHPEWFAQGPEGNPVCYGGGRMGNWSLLMSTCTNGGYRNEEAAAPILKEAVGMLELDGVFFNAPHMEKCYCENCRRKYRQFYGEELPQDSESWRPDWAPRCLKDNIMVQYRAVKETRDIPVILYYGTYREDGKKGAEDLDARYATADLICTEAQDILSAGKEHFPRAWKPSLNMKLGQYLSGKPRPFGIIHSCPGMDWRHTGLPAAEYEFWMSQIPASGGQLWHSLTGFDATITDKRLLRSVERVNRKAELSDELMRDAVCAADVLLLWDAGISCLNAVDALMRCHIPFDLCDDVHVRAEVLEKYRSVLLPDGFGVDERLCGLLRAYVEAGGSLYVEKTDACDRKELEEILGIQEGSARGKGISAAYGVLEEDEERLGEGLEDTCYIPVKGNLLYTRKKQGAKALMTLVPSFAPLDGVGAPPERASIPVPHTQIPLILANRIARGKVLSCFFDLSGLIGQIGLADWKILFENCFSYLTEGKGGLNARELPEGVFIYPYRTREAYLIHLVNGIGERPLRSCQPCYRLGFQVRVGERAVKSVDCVLEDTRAGWQRDGDMLTVTLESLHVWELVRIRWKEMKEE
jgi:hypothetical protein